jgi:nicotinamide riboside kinase
MRTIIIEGPDHTGKTTLAKMFATHFGMPIIHSDYTEEAQKDMFQYHLRRIRKARHLWGAVLDRTFISEQIYGPIFRGTMSLTHQGVGRLEREIEHAFKILCMPLNKTRWLEEFKKDMEREMFQDVEKIEQVYDAYAEYDPINLWDYVWDYHCDKFETLLEYHSNNLLNVNGDYHVTNAIFSI